MTATSFSENAPYDDDDDPSFDCPNSNLFIDNLCSNHCAP